MGMKTCAFYTLGCKVNQYETEKMLREFKRYGLKPVDFSEGADIYVINTCTVTGGSDHKSRQIIRRAVRENPAALVAVTGCYAQSKPQEIAAIPGIKLVINNQMKTFLPELVLEEAGVLAAKNGGRLASRQEFHTRALIKIQDGCDQYCSFCIVPYLRGKPSSRPEEKIINEARELAQEGTKEIVLTGVHLGKYGLDLNGQTDDLVRLLSKLVRIKGLARIRLSSIEVREVTPKLISLLASSAKFCRHLHIPLQSGDDEILKAMNRNYTSQEYLEIIRSVKAEMPEIGLTTDIMVGFPGETEEQFQKTVEIVQKMKFSKLHVFKFSSRPGTAAASMKPQVPEEIRKHRSQRMIELGEKQRKEFLKNHLGRDLEVLVEEKSCLAPRPSPLALRDLTGLTNNYIRVYFKGPEELKREIVKVRTKELMDGGLHGELL